MEQTPKEKDIEYGTLDDLIEAALPLVVAGEAEDFMNLDISNLEGHKMEHDASGTLICPGHPKLCLGSGDIPGIECCCDECDYYLECFPEAMP